MLWIIVVVGEGLYLNYLANQFKLLNQNTHLPLILFVLLNGFSSAGLILNSTHLVHLFLLLALHQMLQMYNERKVNFKAFNVGLFVGLASVIYLPVVVLMLLVWFVIRYVKPIYWKEYVASILGFVVPCIYVGFYYFMNDNLTLENVFFLPSSTHIIETNQLSVFEKINWHYVVFIALFAIFSILFSYAHIQTQVVKVRKYITILLLLLLVLFVSQLVFEPITRTNIYSYQLFIIPLTIIFSIPLIEMKRTRIAEGIFYLFILMIIGNYVF
ncbi:MAG: hypothetical protein K0B10_13135 [Vicingaceae bacterium]|nr:hypothetical protein [Vicingaceae bacterium]